MARQDAAGVNAVVPVATAVHTMAGSSRIIEAPISVRR